ncbi:MAG: rhomboid family intramembrane serine protease [Parvularculaceae bacterium]|nr:rhomboid family intramembrane serine protease [Parvularculaceae bacterium]
MVPGIVTFTAASLAAVFVLSVIAPRAVIWLFGAPGLSPIRFFAGPANAGGLFAWASPLFTHVWLHAGIAHLLFNALWLVVFGSPLARRLRSPLRFLAFFMLCGAAGGLFYAFLNARDAAILIGASGGVTGLLGGLVRFAFQNPPRGSAGLHRLPLSDRSVLTWSAIVIALNASITVFGPGVGAGDANVAWQAHIGGFLFGLVAFPLFDRRA